MAALYPLLLQPSLHTKVWGGCKLADEMHKPLPTDEPYGEAWELHDTSIIDNGVLARRPLGDVLAEYGTQLVGEDNDPAEGFPLLVKLLDAADWLSVQVHPNDVQAAELEGQPRGKTEAWYILATDPDAKLVIGVEPGTQREAMAKAIREGTLQDILVYQDIEPMDLLYIPAGTIHAIGPGTLLYEIQQSSNTTYRLYDWNRMGLDGQPRELHIEKGVQVSNVDSVPEVQQMAALAESNRLTLVAGEFFTTEWMRNPQQVVQATGGHFHALTCPKGEITVQTGTDRVTMTTGRTVLIPASIPNYTLEGQGEVLLSYQS